MLNGVLNLTGDLTRLLRIPFEKILNYCGSQQCSLSPVRREPTHTIMLLVVLQHDACVCRLAGVAGQFGVIVYACDHTCTRSSWSAVSIL